METDNYEFQGNHMRRRRNVSFTDPNDHQQSENNAHLGIQWDTNASEIEVATPYDESEAEENDSFEGDYKAQLSNHEKVMVAKDQETTIQFCVGNCEVSIGQLQALKKSGDTQKLTVYLDADLVDVMKALKKAHLVPSCSWLVSEAVKQYLITNGS